MKSIMNMQNHNTQLHQRIKMFRFVQYTFAYFCLAVFWLIFLYNSLCIIGVIDSHGGAVGLAALATGFYYAYDRNKPKKDK